MLLSAPTFTSIELITQCYKYFHLYRLKYFIFYINSLPFGIKNKFRLVVVTHTTVFYTYFKLFNLYNSYCLSTYSILVVFIYFTLTISSYSTFLSGWIFSVDKINVSSPKKFQIHLNLIIIFLVCEVNNACFWFMIQIKKFE